MDVSYERHVVITMTTEEAGDVVRVLQDISLRDGATLELLTQLSALVD